MTKIQIRNATKEDSNEILKWRNDEHTRKMSFNTEEISQEQHDKWYTDTLKLENRKLFIITDEDKKLGIIRFDINQKNAEISINMAPEHRGKGYGKETLNEAIKLAQKMNIDNIIAQIKPTNSISLNLFKNAGFQIEKEDQTKIQMNLRF